MGENNETNRQRYRELLFTTQNLEEYISGVIMFEETLYQRAKDGRQFVDILKSKGIIPGIKTDKGTRQLPFCSGEKYTQGLTDLDVRSKKYYEQGARMAKWAQNSKRANNGDQREGNRMDTRSIC